MANVSDLANRVVHGVMYGHDLPVSIVDQISLRILNDWLITRSLINSNIGRSSFLDCGPVLHALLRRWLLMEGSRLHRSGLLLRRSKNALLRESVSIQSLLSRSVLLLQWKPVHSVSVVLTANACVRRVSI